MASSMETAIAALAWVITIYKFKAVWRDSRGSLASVTFYFWAFTFWVAIGLSLMIEDLYLVFDRLIGIPNFGWLIAYISFSLAIYSISAGCYLVLNITRPRVMSYSLVLTLLVLCTVYFASIINLPEKPDHTVPEMLSEFIFMQTLYLYVAAFCVIPFMTFTRLYRQERIVSARLRWLVALGTTLSSAVVAVLKVILTILAYDNQTTPALNILHPLITVFLAIAGISWPLAFLPNGFYIALARPFTFFSKVKALKELKMLRSQLDRICPPVIDESPGLIACLDNIDFHLYRAVIAILDAKKTLAGYAHVTNDLAVTAAAVTRGAGKKTLNWDDESLRQARLLHQLLRTVNDHVEFSELVQAYQGVGRMLRQQV
jgi:hypothetical protein